MTDPNRLQTVLQQVTRLPGVAQAFFVLADRTVQSASAPGQPTREDDAWVALSDTLDPLQDAVQGTNEVLWTFNDWCVLLSRLDGMVFGALIEKPYADKAQTQARAMLVKAGLQSG